MEEQCERCKAGPTGANGHDGLFAESFFKGNVLLKCRQCASRWTRKGGAETGFLWESALPGQGMMTP